MRFVQFALLSVSLFLISPIKGTRAETATGFVFNDLNLNGTRDSGEAGIKGVRVSNGQDVVLTDAEGKYEIEANAPTIIFVCKPKGWIYPVNDLHMPQFFLHSQARGIARRGLQRLDSLASL